MDLRWFFGLAWVGGRFMGVGGVGWGGGGGVGKDRLLACVRACFCAAALACWLASLLACLLACLLSWHCNNPPSFSRNKLDTVTPAKELLAASQARRD